MIVQHELEAEISRLRCALEHIAYFAGMGEAPRMRSIALNALAVGPGVGVAESVAVPQGACERVQGGSSGDEAAAWKLCPECKGHGQPAGDGSGWDGTSMHTPACALCGGRGEVPMHFPCGNWRDSCHGDPEVEECACWRRWREEST